MKFIKHEITHTYFPAKSFPRKVYKMLTFVYYGDNAVANTTKNDMYTANALAQLCL